MILDSERLKNLRKSKSLLQKDVADALGLSLRAYQSYERGARNPNIQTLRSIAEFFDVSTDYLMGTVERSDSGGADQQSKDQDSIKELREAFLNSPYMDDINEMSREELRGFAKALVDYVGAHKDEIEAIAHHRGYIKKDDD